jgi:hypothetical protein
MTKYRTSGAWGPGEGRNLTAGEVDDNFYGHETRIGDLETDPPAAVGISNFVVDGTQLTIFLSNGTQFGPYTLPTAVFRSRGEWAAATGYFAMDLVTVAGSGLYLVLQNHTSDATFDEDATNSSGDLYQLIFPSYAPAAVKTVSTATYTPGLADANKYHRCTVACVITIPSGLFPLNTELHFRQASTGPLTIINDDSGGIINTVEGFDSATDRLGAVVTVKQVATDVWDIFGQMAEVTA